MVFYSSNKFSNHIEAILKENADTLHLFTVKEFYEQYEILNVFIEHCETGLSETPDTVAFLRNEHINNSLDKYFNDLGKVTEEIRIQTLGFKDAINAVDGNLIGKKPINDYFDADGILYFTLYLLGYTKAFYVAYLKDVQKLGIESVRENLEAAKKETEKLAWLYELGILELIKNRCVVSNSVDYRLAGKVIASFTDIKAETARKNLEAIYKPNVGNKKNNPLNSNANKEFVLKRLKEFKLELLNKEIK